MIVVDGQIFAFDEQHPEIARQMGLLGIALVEPSRRQQRDARIGAA